MNDGITHDMPARGFQANGPTIDYQPRAWMEGLEQATVDHWWFF